MTTTRFFSIFALGLFCSLLSCNSNESGAEATGPDSLTSESTAAVSDGITEIAVAYSGSVQNFKTVVAYKTNASTLPVVLVVPEWWGVNEYTRSRVRQLAELGYFAMAVDMYGNGKVAETPDSAGVLATSFYKDPQMAKAHFDAALTKAKTFPNIDSNRIAAIGYCFGGGMVLNMARLGVDLKGVVSFHGSLNGYLPPTAPNTIKAKILVCHGNADAMVPQAEVKAFKKEMDAAHADYTFIGYDSAKHAFTNPDATALGEKYDLDIAYNEAADKASWTKLTQFLSTIFE